MWFQERREFKENLGGVDGEETIRMYYVRKVSFIFNKMKKSRSPHEIWGRISLLYMI